MVGRALGIVTSNILPCKRIDLRADTVERVGNFKRRPLFRALKLHMLNKMRNAAY